MIDKILIFSPRKTFFFFFQNNKKHKAKKTKEGMAG